MAALKKNIELKIPKDLPKAVGWRIVLVLPSIESTTAGGIILPDQVKDKEGAAVTVAYVASIGPDCYLDEKRYPNGAWCKVGDWVLIGKYAGSAQSVGETEIRIINEDNVLAVVSDPNSVSRSNKGGVFNG